MYQNPAGFFSGAPTGSPAGFNPQQHSQNPQMQPGGQPGNPMMFNPQQFQNMAGPGFMPGNPAMMGAQGGMMQNPAMQHMAVNGQPRFPNPQFQGQPFPTGSPSSSGQQPQFNQNFMMGNAMGFPGASPSMPGQSPSMQQRHSMPQGNMPGQMGMGTPQRPMSVASQGTPTSMQKPQFATPQAPPTSAMQPPGAGQPQSATITTPQTPTFPTPTSATAPGNALPTSPLAYSPRTEALEKERCSLMLEINGELLYETIQLQYTMAEAKKEGDKHLEEEASKDNTQCLRRLSANLQFLAALADPKLKGLPRPAVLTPPPLNLDIKLRISPQGIDGDEAATIDAASERIDRDKLIKELYTKLQGLFPGVNPNKEVTFNNARPNTQPGQPHGTPQQQHNPHPHSQQQAPIQNPPKSSATPQPQQQQLHQPPLQQPPTPQPAGQSQHQPPSQQSTPQPQAKQQPPPPQQQQQQHQQPQQQQPPPQQQPPQQPPQQHPQMRGMGQQPQMPPQQMMPQQMNAQQRQMMAIQQQMAHMGAMNPMGQMPHPGMGHMPPMGHQMGHMPMNPMQMGQMQMGQMGGMPQMNPMQQQMQQQMQMNPMGMMGGMGQFGHMGQMNPMQMSQMGSMGQIPGAGGMQQRPPMPSQGGGSGGMPWEDMLAEDHEAQG